MAEVDNMSLEDLIDDAEEHDEEEFEVEEEEQDTEEEESEEEDTEEDLEEEEEEESEDDEDDEEEEENDSEEDSETEDDEPTFTISIAGEEVQVTAEQMKKYAQKGADNFATATTATQEQLILEQNKITAEELKLITDARNGSAEAIAKIAELGKVDILDIEPELADKYKHEQEYNQPSEVDRVAQEIMQDTEHATVLQGEISKVRNVAPDFVDLISSNHNALRDFSSHVKSGLAQKVIPLAMNEMYTTGTPFAQAYAKIGQEMERTMKTEKQKPQRTVTKREQELRKKASASSNGRRQKQSSAEDVWEMSDSEFDKLLGEPSYN